jgi:TonB family protein|tara:strand:+ start:174 stop:587 length:414 start_codon:yes stop_codon:yes gene_type:complete
MFLHHAKKVSFVATTAVFLLASQAIAQQVLGVNVGQANIGGVQEKVRCELIGSGPLRYPPKAKRYKYVGQVIVKFGVGADGGVTDPFVVAAEPPGVFERAALTHVKSFKYNPPLHNGEPVAVDEVAVKLVFDPNRRR